jgi:hypothetical protein
MAAILSTHTATCAKQMISHSEANTRTSGGHEVICRMNEK